MGKSTHIQWTGATWNPWQGCRTKSEGCRFCYMFRDKRRYGQDPKHIHRSADGTFRSPLKWQREAASGKRTGADCFVFTCSWSDWFIREADAWRDEAWDIIRQCPDLIFQILTKRPERMADHLPVFWDEIRGRCWLGISAEDQRNYDLRRPFVDQPLSPVMWWSLEPLLGPIDLGIDEYTHKPAWFVVGGESGSDPGIRPMHPDWARTVRDWCQVFGIPFHFKQWGEWVPFDDPMKLASTTDKTPVCLVKPDGRVIRPYAHEDGPGQQMVRVGKKAAGRLFDGREWNEFPQTNPTPTQACGGPN